MEDKEKAKKWPVENYSRVVGYLSPVSGWNKGKKEEWEDRKEYSIPGNHELPIKGRGK